jgi:hypothetical protein
MYFDLCYAKRQEVGDSAPTRRSNANPTVNLSMMMDNEVLKKDFHLKGRRETQFVRT